jgi:hypothetical protein
VGSEVDLGLPKDIVAALSQLKAKALVSPSVRNMLLTIAEVIA